MEDEGVGHRDTLGDGADDRHDGEAVAGEATGDADRRRWFHDFRHDPPALRNLATRSLIFRLAEKARVSS